MQEGTLHSWFSKSKSKDGKPGWVQSDGSPCANEKGETKTPKCYSSRRLAGLKKTKEGQKKIRSADARKSRQDPGQQSKSGASKPTNVRTFKDKKDYKKHPSGDYKKEEFEMEMQEAKDKKGSGSGKKDACYHKVKSRYSVWPSAYASGALVKCRKKGAANWGNSSKNEEFLALPEFTQLQIDAMRRGGIEVEVVDEACWKGYEKKGMKTMFGKRYPNCVKKTKSEGYAPGDVDQKVGAVTGISKEDQEAARARLKAKAEKKRKEREAANKNQMKEDLGRRIQEDRERLTEVNRLSDEALEKAAAATQKRHKEQGMKIHSTDSMKDVQDRIKKRREQQSEGVLDAALKTDKKMGELHKKVDNDVKRMKAGKKFKEEVECAGTPEGKDCGVHGKKCCPTVKEGCGCDHPDDKKKKMKKKVEEERMPAQNGNVYMVTFSWRGKMMAMKIFFPETRRPSRQEVEDAMCKIYPGCKVRHYDDSYVGQGDGYINVGKSDVYAEFDEGAAWTKKSGKNEKGGLNEKGRKSYEAENPGSDLKRPSKKVGNPRRKSFCARMSGMKKKLTSKKTANDPDSRINKSLRAWNC